MTVATLSQFGIQLRSHRKRRGLSQLQLAVDAGTTARYVSFIETGRSRPGEGVVLRIAETLGLNLRERNELLVSAGLAPAHPELEPGDDSLAPVRKIVQQVLDNHEPYPGFAMGPNFQVRQMNATGECLFDGIRNMSVPEIVARWFPDQTVDARPEFVPVMTPTVVFGDQRIQVITTVMRFDQPLDITTAELVVELMFPADAAAEAFFRAAAR